MSRRPSTSLHHHYRPPRITPAIHPALPGEGVWHATFAAGGSRPPVLITSYRPEADYPSIVAGVAWIDHTRASVHLYPGLQEPAVPLPNRGPMEVPQSMRGGLVATFNSGFKLADSNGGFAYHGRTYAPLHDGMATVVGYRSGRVNVISWTGGPNAGPDVVFARQDLPLIVDHGLINPNLSDGPEWGATLGNAVFVWRSAVGIDRHGNLIYVAAPRADSPLAGPDHGPRRRRPGDGDGHQLLLAELHHLPVPGRRSPGKPAVRHGAFTVPLPDSGRSRLLRRLRTLTVPLR